MLTARADVVGSLLRPPELLEAREAFAAGRLGPAAFKRIEDRAVDQAVALQEAAGLGVVTDGEMRRTSFQAQMTEGVEGFGTAGLDAFLWGEWFGEGEVGDRRQERPPALGVVDKLVQKRSLCAEEFTYLRARTTAVPKVCLPSPSLWANFWPAERPPAAYPSLDAFLADVVDILRREVAELARMGATYIQLDAPHYTALLEPRTRAFHESRGWSGEAWLARGVELDNAVMAGFPQVTFGFHLCRGNQGSRWLVSGGYAPIARTLFRTIAAQRLFLEYDDARAGDFLPLKHVPADKTVVLGLVTTKSGRLEEPALLDRRVREAARFVPLERLALSPQCGFASSIIGNRLTMEEQRRKLKLVVRVAGKIWGDVAPRPNRNANKGDE